MPDAFESFLVEAQTHQTEIVVDHLRADCAGLSISLVDLGTQGLLSYWFSYYLPHQLMATVTIHHPSVLIRPLGVPAKLIQTHGCASACVAEHMARQARRLHATQLGVALGDYNDDQRCFYLGVSYATITEALPVPSPKKPDSPSLDTVLAGATLLHYYMQRVRSRHASL
ncbi:MAG: hypothetical protein CMJ93_06090 [Planctomycetes bacterium]|nr:hypothetical protein [Planctomycetota bacterium]